MAGTIISAFISSVAVSSFPAPFQATCDRCLVRNYPTGYHHVRREGGGGEGAELHPFRV